METVFNFRRICKKFLLCKARNGEDDSDEEWLHNGKKRRNRRDRYESEGIGLLKVNSPDFINNARLMI